MTEEHQFQLSDWGWARVSELFDYQARNVHGAGWGIKGHNRPWLIEKGDWKSGLRFLDVGAGYSDLPGFLAKQFDMEGWVADDFGIAEGKQIWSRWGNPKELALKYPQVKYVFKAIGTPDAQTAFPKAYFDRIYSISTLEHIPRENLGDVFRQMVSLLKPGGVMLHSVDIVADVPLEKFLPPPMANNVLIQGIANWAWELLGHGWIIRNSLGKDYYPASAGGWAHFIKKNLKIVSGKNRFRLTPSYSFLLDSNVLLEPIEVVFKYYPPPEHPKKYAKTGSLLFVLKSLPGEGG